MLEAIGTQFIRTDGKLNIEVVEPFLTILETKSRKTPSELLQNITNTTKKTLPSQEMSIWLPILDTFRTFDWKGFLEDIKGLTGLFPKYSF